MAHVAMHVFDLNPGELVHIGGIPFVVTEDGRLAGANDPKWARSIRDGVPYAGPQTLLDVTAPEAPKE